MMLRHFQKKSPRRRVDAINIIVGCTAVARIVGGKAGNAAVA